MAIRVALDDATDLHLPGRRSREIISGKAGADSTVRLVENSVPSPDAAARPPHWHPDTEEVIHVLGGRGVTWVEGEEFEMQAGDTIRIAPGERHVTRNTGRQPLVLLCFFPNPECRLLTDERPDG